MKRKTFFNFDVFLFGSTVFLIIIGITFIYSSSVSNTGEIESNEFIKQIFWAFFGILILFIIVFFTNYSEFANISHILYWILIGLLVIILIPFIGKEVNNARSWLSLELIGIPIGIQPSELAKITTILFLASFLSKKGEKIKEIQNFLIAFGICLLPFCLILIQPDMGTALVFLPMFLIMAFIAGAKKRHIFFVLLTGLLMVFFSLVPKLEELIFKSSFPLIMIFTDTGILIYIIFFIILILGLAGAGYFFYRREYYYWIIYYSSILLIATLGSLILREVLFEYQQMRLIIFLDPNIDPKGDGYHILQSITAVGSGGFLGQGFGMGIESTLDYLPKQSTDFIFSIIAEQWGFIGGMTIFVLFIIILLRSIRIIYNAKEMFGSLIGAGIITYIFFHIIINIGMAVGMMPITGIPLVFISYGGSSLLTGLIGIGLLLNIHLRRYSL